LETGCGDSVRPGTREGGLKQGSPPAFPWGRSVHPAALRWRSCAPLRAMSPLDMKFHGALIAVDQKEKKTLLGTDRPVTGIASCVAASFPRDLVSECWPISLSAIPAKPTPHAPEGTHKRRPQTGFDKRGVFPFALGPTDPCTNAVHKETCSTLAFKVLI